ncbi:hypothetical protein CCM_04819 [Cordyceps militaris CM01]|uniref:Uncharacterized protein n=1 Tax=Cordyceps militaris (strain CM01) TaxID=983644 RepID=G3JEV2_CORMM|nr:uncharacterized protein CCM_04819 [Cordyceps militaris CM01]EGX93445.1 hypothetical protein CCM_04819 [Cordyceps militaris CM01]
MTCSPGRLGRRVKRRHFFFFYLFTIFTILVTLSLLLAYAGDGPAPGLGNAEFGCLMAAVRCARNQAGGANAEGNAHHLIKDSYILEEVVVPGGGGWTRHSSSIWNVPSCKLLISRSLTDFSEAATRWSELRASGASCPAPSGCFEIVRKLSLSFDCRVDKKTALVNASSRCQQPSSLSQTVKVAAWNYPNCLAALLLVTSPVSETDPPTAISSTLLSSGPSLSGPTGHKPTSQRTDSLCPGHQIICIVIVLCDSLWLILLCRLINSSLFGPPHIHLPRQHAHAT